MNPRITLVMIVRNEAAVLERCLESVKNAVDEMVIVDTGSTDRTVEIARRYTARVYHRPWDDDFAAARNFALERAGGHWILSLDADETLEPDGADLRALAADRDGREAFLLPLYNEGYGFPGHYHYVLRFFRNNGRYRFSGRIHEQVTVADPEKVGTAAGPLIRHHADSERERRRKRGRNLKLLRRAGPELPAPFQNYYLGVEWLALNRPERALPCFARAREMLTDAHLQFRLPALLHLLTCLVRLNRLDEAICLCLEESRRYPFYSDIFFFGGQLFEAGGEFAVAAKWFQEALRCGRPPIPCYHQEGTESFLSYYHLGYCLEQTGEYRQATEYYRRALEHNPDYIYPLYNLFLLVLAEKGAGEAFRYFQAAGCFSRPGQASLLADLFFTAGYPDLAGACLQTPGDNPPGALTRRLIRCHLYAGRPEQALVLIERLRAKAPDLPVTADEITALLVCGEYVSARTRALSLWRRPAGRNEALAFLVLTALMEKGFSRLRPEKHRRAEVIQTLLAAVKPCLCAPPPEGKKADRYRLLAERTLRWLTDLSPAGCAAVCGCLKEQAASMGKLAALKFGPAGGLWPCPTDRPSAYA